MSVHIFLIDSAIAAATFEGNIIPQTGKRQMITKLADYMIAVSAGVKSANIALHLSAVQAFNLVTLASFVAADTITVNGVVFTGSNTPTGAVQFQTGGTDETVANSFAAVINASTSAKVKGMINATRRGTLIFASFANADYITVNGVVFTGKTTPTAGAREFAVGTTNTMCAAAAAKAINDEAVKNPKLYGLVATAATATVTINTQGTTLTLAASARCTAAAKIIVLTSWIPGAIGNLFTLAISAHGSVTGANFASGADGNMYAFLNK